MSSVTDICNLALSNIRGGSINNIETDTTSQAQILRLQYGNCRDVVLTAYPWGFANRVKGLALLTDDVFDWVYAYAYPNDCLKLIRILPNLEAHSATDSGVYRPRRMEELYGSTLARPIEYKTMINSAEDRLIVCNEADARIVYVSAITNPQLFSPTFVRALSYYVAAEIAIPIVGVKEGMAMRQMCINLYAATLAEAGAYDAQENRTDQRESQFISGRK